MTSLGPNEHSVSFSLISLTFILFWRNNSARELSAFAESAMAVNRVVLQHMSLNLLEEFPPYININADIGILADQQEEEEYDDNDGDSSPNVIQLSVSANSSDGFKINDDYDDVTPSSSVGSEKSSLSDSIRYYPSPFGLSPPSDSLLLRRRKMLQTQSLHAYCNTRRAVYITSPSVC